MKQRIICRLVVLPIAVMVLLGGCANINDMGLSVLATKVPAYAIVDEQLVQGDMQLFPDHTGTITLRALIAAPQDTAALETPQPSFAPNGRPRIASCVGRLRYTGTKAGAIDLRCNDGAPARLNVALFGETRGYGYGYTATGLASVVFGMGLAQAQAHLTVPPNMQLRARTDPEGLELQ